MRENKSSRFHKTLGLSLIALLSFGLLAGCTASGGGSSSAAGGSKVISGEVAKDGSGAIEPGVKTATDRSVTVTGTLQLEVKHPVSSAQRIQSLVLAAGGRVDSLSESPAETKSDTDGSNLTVRVPAQKLNAVLTEIKALGKVSNLSLATTDVTDQVTNYAVRIKNLETSIDRLQTLLSKATTTTDLVSIEQTLTQRETDLETLQGQQQSLQDQISFSTLTITLTAPGVVVKSPAPTNFGSGFAAGLIGLFNTLQFLLIALGVILPWAVIIGIVFAIVLYVRKRLIKRRTGHAGETKPETKV